jgi:hypothetical protein
MEVNLMAALFIKVWHYLRKKSYPDDNTETEDATGY